ncbi:glycoside hydrolase family 31 protein [Mucilaginibacter flavus]|uniref:glycoside hydrolase family 31 protein n=1 Tax=Mucilaginibacter flavus TaxID=931504 RepID=UPI0025B45C80|nr:glycoside hydrolase family 31 protein [Mucilaginibacter flavus]MDN3584208.1 glycoside hydrolase family 31 protein [Mucilaginibacter flavus]
METVIAGNVQGFKQQAGVLNIQIAHAEAKVFIYSPTIIRVSISKKHADTDGSFAVIRQPLADFDVDESAEFIKINTTALKLRISKSPLRFSFFTADGKPLSEDDARFGTTWQGERVITHRKLYADEKFIGLGEKTGNLNRRGTSYTNWNTDAVDYGPKSDPLYKTFPFFIGLHSGLTYGLFLDNTHKSYFDFGATTDDEMSWFGADGGDLNYYFFGAQGVAKIIEDYTWLTGRMEMPPLWSLGYQQCRWSYMSAKEVLKIAKTFRKKKIPADVVYCDIDYMEGFKIFTWNKKTFADPQGMMDQLKAMNFHLVTIVDPGIKIEEGYHQYDEGIANDYFAKYPDGENYTGYVWPGRCHFPDFFREDVREWWGAAFTSLTDVGVDGFWNDMNEPAAWGQNMPWIVKFGDKYMPEVRNAYGMQMARATYNSTKTILKNKRPFVLTRAAYAGTQRYSAVWTGDNMGTDEHMLLGQRLVNSLGITGMSFTGVDIGGFTSNPTPELMVRWNSLGVYTPMFRNHAIKGSKMREPWEWGAANEQIIKKDIEQRYRLLPYIYSGFYQSALNGLPISRTLAIEFPFEEKVYYERFQNQFMFGDNLLVAPVESDKMNTEVYLLKGDWYRLSTDEKLKGDKIVNVPSPLTDLPVFAKAGAIIPMQNIVQSTTEKGDGILQLHVWNGKEATEFMYYEDDGDSYDYENGAYYKRIIRFDPKHKIVRLLAVEGSFVSRFSKVKIVWHGFETQNKPITSIPFINDVIELKY